MRAVLLLCLLALTDASWDHFNVESCPFVARLDHLELRDCTFSPKQLLQCDLYAVARDVTILFPVSTAFRFHVSLRLLDDEESLDFNGTEAATPWRCLTLESYQVLRVDQPPPEAHNVYHVAHAAAGLLATIVDGAADLSFNGSAVAGFLELDKDCRPPFNDSCIKRVRGAYYAVAPAATDNLATLRGPADDVRSSAVRDNPGDFGTLWEHLQREFLWLYTKLLRTTVRSLTLSTTLRGSQASAWFPFLQHVDLLALNASHNNFAGVLPKVFRKMNMLKSLRMSSCGMTGMDKNNFFKIWNIEELDLSDNLFTKPPEGLGLTFGYLRSLDLGVGPSVQPLVPQFVLGEELRLASKLTWLRLAGLPLQNISRLSLPVHLQYLDLSDCGLSWLSPDTFLDLSSLLTLRLSHNRITAVPASLFLGLAPGARLLLGHNKMEVGPRLILAHLALLDLSDNRLRSPQGTVISGTVDLLDLSGNQIVNWTTPHSFSGVSRVNLSRNSLPTVTLAMVTSLDSLTSVDLGANLLDCQDCSLRTFQRWLNDTHTSVLVLNVSKPLRCSLPVKQKGELLLRAEYNVTACEVPPPDLLLDVALPCGVVFAVMCLVSLAAYLYRFELTYLRHLINVKRKHARAAERDGCRYDVFVSYSGKDRDWVIDVLLPGLENPTDRYCLCLHERDFKLGSYIMENVVDCIDTSRRVLLVLSPNFVRSEWCKWELQMAQHRIFEERGDFLVLLELQRLPRTSLPLHLRVLMDSRTYLEWPAHPSGLRSFWHRLKDALGPPLTLSVAPEEDDVQQTLTLSGSPEDGDDQQPLVTDSD